MQFEYSDISYIYRINKHSTQLKKRIMKLLLVVAINIFLSIYGVQAEPLLSNEDYPNLFERPDSTTVCNFEQFNAVEHLNEVQCRQQSTTSKICFYRCDQSYVINANRSWVYCRRDRYFPANMSCSLNETIVENCEVTQFRSCPYESSEIFEFYKNNILRNDDDLDLDEREVFSLREISPSSSRAISPSSSRAISPSSGRGSSPSSGRGISSSSGRGSSPSSGRGSSPSSGRGSSPSSSRGISPFSSQGISQSLSRGSFPSSGRGSFPSSSRGISPFSGRGISQSLSRGSFPSSGRGISQSLSREISSSSGRGISQSLSRGISPSSGRGISQSSNVCTRFCRFNRSKRYTRPKVCGTLRRRTSRYYCLNCRLYGCGQGFF